MSKHVLLTCFFFLIAWSASWANSIMGGTPVVPAHSDILLPVQKELVFDLAKLKSDPEIFEKIKSAEFKGDKTDKFYFPGLDKQLASFELANLNAPPVNGDDEVDDMSSIYTENPETEAEKKGRQAIDYSKVGGTKLESLSDLGNIGELKLPAYYIQPIGNLEAIIVLNSVTLTAEGGRLGVYVGLNIPQKGRDPQGNQKSITLIFGTEDLGFSQEGGIQVGSLLLLNNVSFELAGAQKKSVVTINGGTKTAGGGTPTFSDDEFEGTYIKFGCDGIEEFGLSGKIRFSREWLVPVDEAGEQIDDSAVRVEAVIGQMKFKDWNDLLVEGVGITPFVLEKYPDISFELTNANIDLSDTRNPGTLKFPDNYVQPEGVPLELWRGVYIQTIAVTLPSPFKKRCDGGTGGTGDATPFENGLEIDFDIQDELLAGNMPNLAQMDTHWETDIAANHRGPNPPEEIYTPPTKPLFKTTSPPVEESCRIKISAKDLIIDRTGVTGSFSVSSQVPLAQGALMDKKWSWTLNDVSIDLLQSNIVGFAVAGDIVLPIAKKETPLAYTAGLTLVDANNDDDYRDEGDTREFFFNVEIDKKMEFPLWKAAEVTIEPNSELNIVYEINSEEFVASATLFGKMEIGKGDPDDDASVPGVKFTNIGLSTRTPFITGGSVYITTGASKMSGFPVQIAGIGIGFGEQSCFLEFDIGLSLMKQEDGGLNASGGFEIHAKMQTNVLGAHEWVFDRIELKNITVTIDLPAFKGTGSLTIFKEDPTYGKGFSAYLSACVMCKQEGEGFTLEMAAVFGNKDGLRYFMVDGYASGGAISVPLPPTPLALNGFGGGVFYHMKPTGFQHPDSTPPGTAIPAGSDTSGLIYTPTSSTVFGIKFSLGITTVGGTNTFSGKLDCIIRFGPGVSLQNIMFWGVGEFVNPAGDLVNLPEVPDFDDRIEGLAGEESAMHSNDAAAAKAMPDKIGAKVGISLDFESGLPPTLHGYAEVFLDVAGGAIKGSGTMDLLVDPHQGKFHIFVGGYKDGTIKVPDFLNPQNEITLYPVNVMADFGTISARVDTYFLLGTHIPGPPPLDPEVASFFDIPVTTNNRDELVNEACNNNPADGSGIAFGASLKLKLEHKIRKKKLFGKGKKTIVHVKVQGGLGFDISLLQYQDGTTCGADANFHSPHGLNYFRATGRIYAYVDVTGKVFKFKIPAMGVGVYLEADIPDPAYFNARIVLKFIKKWKFNVELGEQCGRPCGG